MFQTMQLMAGVPAKQIGWVCECGEVLHEIQHAQSVEENMKQMMKTLRVTEGK